MVFDQSKIAIDEKKSCSFLAGSLRRARFFVCGDCSVVENQPRLLS